MPSPYAKGTNEIGLGRGATEASRLLFYNYRNAKL